MKRVFVAIKLSEELQQEIVVWQEGHALPVRWIASKNLHVTLVPPWYETDTERVVELLKKVKSNEFDIAFNNVSYGPDPKRPRLIWASGKAPEELVGLYQMINTALNIKSGKLLLHATIARFREEDFKNFSVKKIDEKVDWKMRVTSIVLMESKLSSSGADYEVLAEVTLGS